MKLRIIKADGMLQPGDIIQPDMIGVAELYVERGVAEWIEKPEQFPPPNKMVRRDKVKTKA